MATPGDVMKLFGTSVGFVYFILLVIVDAWTSIWGKPCRMWISGNAFILSAFTIQVLSYLNLKNIVTLDKPSGYKDTPEQFERMQLLSSQFVIDIARLVTSVFIGYLLPGMVGPGSASQMAALVVCLISAFTSEVYFIRNSKDIEDFGDIFYYSHTSKHSRVWLLVSSVVVYVLVLMLTLLLVSAILAAKTVRGILSKRIQSVIERSSNTDCSDSGRFEDDLEKFEDGSKDYLSEFEDVIMRSWVLCRVGKPRYVIARSVLSSSVGVLVTFGIVLLVAKALNLKSEIIIFHYDGWDWLRYVIFGLQCTFVILGWLVILWRYLNSVLYFPRRFSSGRGDTDRRIGCSRCVVEDFWTRSISDLIDMYDSYRWRQTQLPQSPNRKWCNRIVGYAAMLKLHKLLYFVWHLQNIMVLFSKCCWLISSMVLRSECLQKCVLGVEKLSLYSSFPEETRLYQEFLKYKDALQHMCMPGEHPAALWLANETAFRQAQERFRKGSSYKQWHQLSSFLTNHLHRDSIQKKLEELDLVKEYFPILNDNCWKIVAVSLLRIMITVSSSNQGSYLMIESAIQVCQQAWDLMTFAYIEQPISINVVQVFYYELDQISVTADNEFKKLIAEFRKLKAGDCSYKEKFSKGHERSAQEAIHLLLEKAEKELKDKNLLPSKKDGQAQEEDDQVRIPLDSIDWNAVVPAYNMYRVCKLICNNQVSHGNHTEMVDFLYDLLGRVIGNCLVKLPRTIVRSCRNWAVASEEEKIWEAIYIAGKSTAFLNEIFKGKLAKDKRMPKPVEVQPRR